MIQRGWFLNLVMHGFQDTTHAFLPLDQEWQTSGLMVNILCCPEPSLVAFTNNALKYPGCMWVEQRAKNPRAGLPGCYDRAMTK